MYHTWLLEIAAQAWHAAKSGKFTWLRRVRLGAMTVDEEKTIYQRYFSLHCGLALEHDEGFHLCINDVTYNTRHRHSAEYSDPLRSRMGLVSLLSAMQTSGVAQEWPGKALQTRHTE